MVKILILSVFPAPYRVAVFEGLSKEFELSVFFERNKDEDRNADWFEKKNRVFDFRILDNSLDILEYEKKVKQLSLFDLVLCYDPWTKRARKLQRKCIKMGIPYVLNADGAVDINDAFPKKQIKTYFVKKAKMCFAGCNKAEKYFETYGAKKNQIKKHPFTSLYKKEILDIPYSIDEKQDLRQELGIDDKILFLAVGQFIYRKGFDLLLKAWEDSLQNAQLYIIGGGGLKKEYENSIEQRKLKNIHIIDFKKHDELIKYYLAADVFIMPTREDIWGLVINEAMACGLPIITSDRCTAGCELVSDGFNGYIYNYEDTKNLAKLIDKLSSDEKMRKSFAEESLKVISEYTYENIIQKHIDCINSLG